MHKIKTSISKQFKNKKMDFCDDIEVQYCSELVEDTLEEFVMDKPTMHVMMMLIIDESYAFLDIPEGKRRLGESSKKGAI
jgi:hypothetical protein